MFLWLGIFTRYLTRFRFTIWRRPLIFADLAGASPVKAVGVQFWHRRPGWCATRRRRRFGWAALVFRGSLRRDLSSLKLRPARRHACAAKIVQDCIVMSHFFCRYTTAGFRVSDSAAWLPAVLLVSINAPEMAWLVRMALPAWAVAGGRL